MIALFTTLIYAPIFNLFVGLYHFIPDVGVVIAIVTVLVKVILYPLTSSSIKAQKSLSELQPKIEALKVQYKDDKQGLSQATMQMYKENKVNPFGSCLPILIQLPIFIGLYRVLQAGLKSQEFNLLYHFVPNPGTINPVTLHYFNLAAPSIVLAALAAAAQFWQTKMFTRKKPPVNAGAGSKDEGTAAMMNKQMLYMMPILTLIIGFRLPAGLTLYWLLSTVLTALQQLIVFKKNKATGTGVSGTPTPPAIS